MVTHHFTHLTAISLTLFTVLGGRADGDGPYTDSIGESALHYSDARYRRATISPSLIHLDTSEQRQ